jgi:hypothetical protein
MGRTNRPRLVRGPVGPPLVLVPELARVVRLLLPVSQLASPALEWALPQPPVWAVLRLA